MPEALIFFFFFFWIGKVNTMFVLSKYKKLFACNKEEHLWKYINNFASYFMKKIITCVYFKYFSWILADNRPGHD